MRVLRIFESWPVAFAHLGAAAMAAYCVALPTNEADMFAWAQLVRMNPAPAAIFETWLPRAFGYKIFVYTQYAVAHWLAGFVAGADVTFYAGNLCLVAVIALVAWVAARTLGARHGAQTGATATPVLFSCLFILLCAMPVRAFGEPEHIALLFCVLLGCLVLAPAPLGWARFAACVLLAVGAASQKGITVVFLAPVWLLALASPSVPPSKVWRFTLALIVAVAVYVVCLVSLPGELRDLLADSSFQGPFQFNLHAVLRLFRCLATYTWCQPSWLVMSVFAILLGLVQPEPADAAKPSWLALLRSRAGTALVAGSSGLISLLYVLVQQELFSYHYLALHLTAIFAILFLAIEWGQRRYFVAMSILSALIAPLLSFAPHQTVDSFTGATRALECQAANGRAIAAALRVEKYDGKEPILFLSGGGLNYFVDAPSFDRYFIMLPLARGADLPALANTAVYRETLRDVLGFRGRFIVWNPDWMDFDDTPGLQEMVIPAYQPVALHGFCNVNGLLLERVPQTRASANLKT
jgi:hypothetical protein